MLKRYKASFLRWWLMVVVMLLVGTEIENPLQALIGSMDCEELKRWEDMLDRLEEDPVDRTELELFRALFTGGFKFFTAFERRFPKNLEEICAGRYTPVNCEDLHFPFISLSGEKIRIPLLDLLRSLKPGEVLYQEWVVQPGKERVLDRAIERMYVPDCTTGELILKIYEYDMGNLARYLFPYVTYVNKVQVARMYRQDTPAGYRRALVVRDFLRDFLHLYPRLFQRPLSSLKIDNWHNDVELLKKLRNDFTGGYAQWVSTPSPGNFQIFYEVTPQGDEFIRVEIYGEKGLPIDEELRQYWTEPPRE